MAVAEHGGQCADALLDYARENQCSIDVSCRVTGGQILTSDI